jgi:hypothetical protein
MLFVTMGTCRNPNFGLVTKAKRGCKVAGQEKAGSHAAYSQECKKCEGMGPHTPKATPQMGVGVPVDFQNFRERFQGSKLLTLRKFLYHWKDIEM